MKSTQISQYVFHYQDGEFENRKMNTREEIHTWQQMTFTGTHSVNSLAPQAAPNLRLQSIISHASHAQVSYFRAASSDTEKYAYTSMNSFSTNWTSGEADELVLSKVSVDVGGLQLESLLILAFH